MPALDNLQSADSRTLAFLPGGLGLGLQMTPEGAVNYWSQVADRCALRDNVAEQTRRAFADLTAVLPYGVLCYEIFTLVHDRALFVLEQALRDKFSECGRVRKDDSLDDMLKRARKAGLLEGQRANRVETAIHEMRNVIAHADRYRLRMPPMVALTLTDLAEIINHLWGHNTEGGRLYPAPLARQTVVVARNPATNSSASCLAVNFEDPSGWEEFTEYYVVQSRWPPEAGLHDFHPWFDTTTCPVDYHSGPGTHADAVAWLEGHPPAADTIDVLCRRFLVRTDSHQIWWPVRLEAVGALPASWSKGRWFLVGADSPHQAYAHVRGAASGAGPCTVERTCPGCHAITHDHGTLRGILSRTGLNHAASHPAGSNPSGPAASPMLIGMPLPRP